VESQPSLCRRAVFLSKGFLFLKSENILNSFINFKKHPRGPSSLFLPSTFFAHHTCSFGESLDWARGAARFAKAPVGFIVIINETKPDSAKRGGRPSATARSYGKTSAL
jgi:hypothetical protein